MPYVEKELISNPSWEIPAFIYDPNVWVNTMNRNEYPWSFSSLALCKANTDLPLPAHPVTISVLSILLSSTNTWYASSSVLESAKLWYEGPWERLMYLSCEYDEVKDGCLYMEDFLDSFAEYLLDKNGRNDNND